ncbi:MAG TPA: MFS transporter, partial [Bacillota bacterium]
MSRYHADHRLTLILMILIVGLLNADQNIINATLGPIEKEFQVDDAAIGLMSGLFTLLGAVISLIWGYWSDKSNRKNLFTISVLIGQIPCLLTAFAANYQQFFILRILTGIGVGASFPTIFSMLGDMYSEKERAVAVTWMTTVMGIGQIAGELLGGYLSPSFGWRLPFILVAVPNLLILVIFHLIVAEPKRGMREEAFEELVDAGFVYPKTIKLRDYLNLIKVRTNIYL